MSEALDAISTRLRELASELESESDEERAAKLVREASELATRAGQAVDEALHAGAGEAGEA